MYCKNCGKVLSAGDRFCSGCGTKVEPQVQNRVEADFIPDFQREEKKSSAQQEETPRPRFHLDEFNWDLNGYPTDSKRTEDVDFNWSAVMDEKKKRNYESRVPLFREPVQKPAEEPAPEQEPMEVPEQVEEVIESVKEDELFADMGTLSEGEPTKVVSKKETGRAAKVDKFYTFNKKNEELQALLEQEYERIKNGTRFEDDDEEMQETEAVAEAPAETEKEPEPVPVRIEFDWNAPVESEPEIREVPVSEMTEVQTEPEDSSYICTVWAQTPAGVLAPELYEEADAIVEAAEAAAAEAENEVQADEPAEEQNEEIEAETEADTAAPEQNEEPAEEPATESQEERDCPPSEEDAQKEKAKLAFDDVFGDDDDDADDEKKKGKGLKALAIILCILVVVELCVIGIQYFAPDSAPGKMINNGYKYILTLISGEESAEETGDQSQVEEPTEMEALIAEHEAENKNIAAIVADENMTFEDGEDYGFLDDFEGSYNFTDKSWYTGDDNEQVTYGDEIVKTLIGYYSGWVDKANGKSDDVLNYIDASTEYYIEIEGLKPEDGVEYGINQLKIGEIRAGGSGFYVLTSVELANSDDGKTKTEKQIVYMEPYEKTMKVIVVKKI